MIVAHRAPGAARACPRLAALLLLAAATACSRPASQLVAVVDTDFVEPDPLTAIELSVQTPEGAERSSRRFDLARGAGSTGVALPLSFGVVPEGGDVRRRVRVVARGIGLDGRSRVTRSALTGFVPGAALTLPLFLPRACADVQCPRGTTCVPGPPVACAPDTVDPRQLVPLPPRPDGAELRADVTLPLDPDAAVAPLDVALDTATDSAIDSAFDSRVDAPSDVTDPTIEPPRLIGPLSGSRLLTTRPQLRWQSAAGADAVRVEVCADRACTRVLQQIETSGGSASLGTSAAPARRALFWRARGGRGGAWGTRASATWEVWPGTSAMTAQRVVGRTLDVNGDGYADLAVGSPNVAVMSAPNTGSVRLYYGGPSGVATTPSARVDGTTAGSLFGFAVASVGDVNGDGYGDVAVGATQDGPAGRPAVGMLHVLLGGPAGLRRDPGFAVAGTMMSALYGFAVAGAGDVNGDGYGDVIAGVPAASPGGQASAGEARVYLGGAAGLTPAPNGVFAGANPGEAVGSAVAGVGDVNGDGFDDVAIGAPGAAGNTGVVLLALGGAAGPDARSAATIAGTVLGGRFGAAVAGAGDYNADGLTDIVIGAPNVPRGGLVEVGGVWLCPGAATGALMPAPLFLGSADGMHMGAAVASAGDLDGDGVSDIVIGMPGAGTVGANAGAMRVCMGGAGATTCLRTTLFDGPAAADALGTSAQGLGDLDGDGFDDVATGAPGTRMSAGRVHVFRGSASGLVLPPTALLDGEATTERFGFALALATPSEVRTALSRTEDPRGVFLVR